VLGVNSGGSYLSITRAIYQATLDGCHIINLSLGGALRSVAPLGNMFAQSPCTIGTGACSQMLDIKMANALQDIPAHWGTAQ
jgi:hypothetical protein